MITEITLPKLGESIVEGIIGRWLKKVGERVERDEPLVEVDTDKINTEIPSPVGGYITGLLVEEGQTIAVGTPIALIESDEREEQSDPALVTANGKSNGAVEPPRYSPAVRRLADESGIDPATVVGSGLEGRVTRRDMERAMEQAVEQAMEQKAMEQKAVEQKVARLFSGDEVIPLTSMRRHIAARMCESKRLVPHAWTMVEVDVTKLVAYRRAIKEEVLKREGVNLTYLPFVIKAAVEGLRAYPILNSQWDNDRIVVKKHINIGIAVDLNDGLIVPVIKDADQMSIIGLAQAVHDLATRARTGTLRPEDVEGGTFTINNTGAFGSIMSAPIINYPQAAIMSMETITRRPVVVGDGIAIRDMMNLCVSLDHRVLDGAVIGRFLRLVKNRLESFDASTPIY